MKTIAEEKYQQHMVSNNPKKSWLDNDIKLNVSIGEGAVRMVLAFLLAGSLAFVHTSLYLMIPIIAVSAYLFATGFIHFCYIKYFWKNMLMSREQKQKSKIARELDMPEHQL